MKAYINVVENEKYCIKVEKIHSVIFEKGEKFNNSKKQFYGIFFIDNLNKKHSIKEYELTPSNHDDVKAKVEKIMDRLNEMFIEDKSIPNLSTLLNDLENSISLDNEWKI